MIKPTIPFNEEERVKALHDLDILDTIEEQAFDQLTLIASKICNTPIALVSLIDQERQWFKSHHGLDARETPRDLAFCAHAINKPNEILLVEDASKDERFHDNPLSTGAPNVVFYAGAPLNTPDGYCLGTLCVIDDKPKQLSDDQLTTLKALADQVVAQMELKRKNLILNEKIKIVEQLNQDLDAFSYRLSHDMQTPLRGILTMVEWLKEDFSDDILPEIRNKIKLIDEKARHGLALVNSALAYGKASKATLESSEVQLEVSAKRVFSNLVNAANVHLKLNKFDQIVQTSEFAIELILHHLMTNSIKNNDKDVCSITISANVDNDALSIDYLDNGPGIDPKYTDKVFELFETLDEKSEKSNGIGLATLKTVLNRLSRSIQLIPTSKNEGVHFFINIPL